MPWNIYCVHLFCTSAVLSYYMQELESMEMLFAGDRDGGYQLLMQQCEQSAPSHTPTGQVKATCLCKPHTIHNLTANNGKPVADACVCPAARIVSPNPGSVQLCHSALDLSLCHALIRGWCDPMGFWVWPNLEHCISKVRSQAHGGFVRAAGPRPCTALHEPQ